MSAEGFLLVNLAVDSALLTAVSRCCGTFRLRRIALASLLCAAGAFPAALRPPPWAGPAVSLAVLGVVSAMAVGRTDVRLCALTALLLAAGMLSAGGAALLLSPHPRRAWEAVPAALAGIAAFGLILNLRHPLRGGWQVDVAVRVGDRCARFRALIDTGNCLREPISGQPVLIAEASLLRGLLPVGGCRRVAYGALGGGGTLPCFRPTGVWLERGRKRRPAPQIWIAVVPGRIPGAARALAPCEFAALRI